jgi:hypothetical protein
MPDSFIEYVKAHQKVLFDEDPLISDSPADAGFSAGTLISSQGARTSGKQKRRAQSTGEQLATWVVRLRC